MEKENKKDNDEKKQRKETKRGAEKETKKGLSGECETYRFFFFLNFLIFRKNLLLAFIDGCRVVNFEMDVLVPICVCVMSADSLKLQHI